MTVVAATMTKQESSTSAEEYDTKLYSKHRRKDPTTPASFQDFRQFTVHEFPNLSFLGPASMAVYWFRIYLKEDWIRCNVLEKGTRKCQRRKKTNHRRKKGGNFLHIPKAYNEPNGELTIQEILHRGTAGKHYANSYIGLYNMIRKYGTFGKGENGDIHITGYNCPNLPER